MDFRRLRGLASVVISLVSAFVVVWGISPHPQVSKSLSLPPSESNILRLAWPETARKGDAAPIRLAVELEQPDLYFPANQDGVSGDLPDAFNLLAESRLEMPGMLVNPPGLVSQPLNPDRTVAFNWLATGDEAKKVTGSAWFYLRLIPVGEGEEQRMALSAQTLELRTVDLLGLDGQTARTLGFSGVLAGLMLSIDLWLGGILKFFKRRS